jgi:hypothetical protein
MIGARVTGRGTAWATAAAVALAAWTACAHASFRSLADRVPDSANAVVAVNVEKVLATPFAKAEWAPNTPESWAKQPMMIPPGSKRLLTVSDVRTDTMEPYWEMSLMEMAKVPPLKALAAADGGNIDRVWDKDAVASPINAYFVPLDGTTLASITPANRSAIAKWVRTAATQPSKVKSDYIQNVLAGLGDANTDIVMAMDLEGAFGVPRIRRWLDDNDIKEIKEADRESAARTLGTMKGITLTAIVGQDVSGRVVVDFDGDASRLSTAAKPILLGVLRSAGMRIDDLDAWTFTAVGKQVTAQGKLSTPSLRNLLSIVSSPIPAATIDERPAGAQAANAADPAAASQRYYKSIAGFLDSFSAQNSAADGAKWARSISKRIDQLPILNVDPALVQWGSTVSLKLKQVGAGMATAQTAINSRVAGVADPGYASYTDNEGNAVSDVDRVATENAKQQRRQAALEQRAQAQEQATRILEEIAQTRPAVRAAMVEKYKVEF